VLGALPPLLRFTAILTLPHTCGGGQSFGGDVMDFQLGNTNLFVTGVVYQESQTSLLRDECHETVTLMSVMDKKTGVRGHVYHEIVVDKREILEENFWTDNQELFKNEHPEAYVIQEVTHNVPHGTPRERTEEVMKLITACCENAIEYRQDDNDEQCWGLYVR